MARKPKQAEPTMRPSGAEVEAHLKQLCDANGGRITPEQVLEDAKDPESPIHDYFEWDNNAAANRFRLGQARALIRSVEYLFRTETHKYEVPYFVRDPNSERGESAYVPVVRVRTNEDMSRDVLIQKFVQARNALESARKHAILFGLEAEIDRFVHELDVTRARATQYAQADQPLAS